MFTLFHTLSLCLCQVLLMINLLKILAIIVPLMDNVIVLLSYVLTLKFILQFSLFIVHLLKRIYRRVRRRMIKKWRTLIAISHRRTLHSQAYPMRVFYLVPVANFKVLIVRTTSLPLVALSTSTSLSRRLILIELILGRPFMTCNMSPW